MLASCTVFFIAPLKKTSPYITAVSCCVDCQPSNQPSENSKQRSWIRSISLQFAHLLMTLLETMQSVASSVIFYQLLKSGDVEQNPGPGSYNYFREKMNINNNSILLLCIDLDYNSVDSGQILGKYKYYGLTPRLYSLQCFSMLNLETVCNCTLIETLWLGVCLF